MKSIAQICQKLSSSIRLQKSPKNYLALGVFQSKIPNSIGQRRYCIGASGGDFMINSASSPQRSHSTLTDCLKREIEAEKAQCIVDERLMDLQSTVSKVFNIQEKPGDMQVVLTGKLKNDDIRVVFNAEDSIDVSSDETEEETEGMEETEDNEYENENDLTAVECTVTISRGNDELVFECLAGENLTVDKVNMISTSSLSTDQVTYTGALFDELDPALQDRFLDYLDERHINDELAEFISFYSDLKEQKEYVQFLEKTHSFVSGN